MTHTFRVFIYALLPLSLFSGIALFLAIGPAALIASPIFAILNGVAFNWINVQVHEASHGLLLRQRKWNDAYCNLALVRGRSRM